MATSKAPKPLPQSKAELQKSLRSYCLREYERFAQREWNEADFKTLDYWQRQYEAFLDLGERVARVKTEIKRLATLKSIHPENRFRAWAREARRDLEGMPSETPMSLRAFIVESLDGLETWADVATDTRRAAGRASTKPAHRWGTASRRPLTPREMAVITLLIGLPPMLEHSSFQPNHVVQREMKAILEIYSRRSKKRAPARA